ncbi:TIGR04219 family outer membrane beta-barrel protein [Litoribrevibacter albus]|uniref:Membrane protein n=1 Tax=Litoribrevibacter albus TaxID=1473156 RepID=A0AA37W858_9GAMM|nr:TIGR04219 family outer membrane beta-barrel protein [Litoribrevibacter albus]GLQ31874.1 membrane protein [Litoribrevibacter albus]
MTSKGLLYKGLLASSLVLSTAVAQADIIGVHGRVGAWLMDYSGEFTDTDNGGTKIDIEDDLGFDGETIGFAEIAFEHPIPVLPNIKLAYLSIDTHEENTLSKTIIFEDTTFTANTDIKTDFETDMYDFTMYYELLDNWVQADVGLTVRYLDIDLAVEESTGTVSTDVSFSTPLPLLYANAQFDLPFTNVYANVNVNGLSVSDVTVYDAQAAIGWMPLEFIGGEVGYRHFVIDADDLDDYEFDITLSGPYLAIKADF